jgi:hypothetical protein
VTDKNSRLSSFDDVADRVAALQPELRPLGLHLASPDGVLPPADPETTHPRPRTGGVSEGTPTTTRRPELPNLPRATDPPRPLASGRFDAVLAAMHDLGTRVRKLPPRTLAAATAGSGLLVVLVLVLGVVSLAHGCGSSVAEPGPPVASAAVVKRPGPVVSAAESASIPSADEEVPVISVDSLPSAPVGHTASKGSGRGSTGRGGSQP